MTDAPGSLARWILAARPRTLPAAIVPVVIGAGVVRPGVINWLDTALCAVVALALQVGTNYANDYSDGRRGTDEQRVGPFRLTASGLTSPARVKFAAWAWFAVAACAGLWLSSRTSWWLVAIGASAIVAGWLYTGGPKPYGYYGYGEFFVLVYFGFVATVGTAYVQQRSIPSSAWWWGLAAGSMACALLEANNLRDVDGDQLAGKKTLAARLGRARGAWLYVLWVVAIVWAMTMGGGVLAALVALVMYLPGVKMAFSPRRGRELLALLKISARAQLVAGAASLLVFFARG
ncbi:MAG TPA: 1,4-dihydroxy-2-naphthoate polyprenyltransferase [Acidimicrobiales bacterium]|nr:1,4-dihydroxy-2-naphthoate polyprenyltransferase [Acidimicrobiales bacterium]